MSWVQSYIDYEVDGKICEVCIWKERQWFMVAVEEG